MKDWSLRTRRKEQLLYSAFLVLFFQMLFLTFDIYLQPTVKLRAVDQTTIQFWTLLSKGHST